MSHSSSRLAGLGTSPAPQADPMANRLLVRPRARFAPHGGSGKRWRIWQTLAAWVGDFRTTRFHNHYGMKLSIT